MDRIFTEAEGANLKYGPFTSTHEALGVLIEELDELKVAIHLNDRKEVEREAIQVAAVALRLFEGCHVEAFRERSGFVVQEVD